jgi:hypothetical protein
MDEKATLSVGHYGSHRRKESVSAADNRFSAGTTVTSYSNQQNNSRVVRTLPPWVLTSNSGLGAGGVHTPPQMNAPEAAHSPPKRTTTDLQRRISKDGYEEWVDEKTLRSHKLPQILRRRADKPGRRWDHLRTADPVIMGTGYRPPNSDPYGQWRDMFQSSRYGHAPNEESEIVTDEFLHQLQPGLDTETQAPYHPRDPKSRTSRKQKFVSRFWHFMLRHPITPLIFRLVVLATSIAALIVSVNIFEGESSTATDPNARNMQERDQAIVAIVIDTVAIPYIIGMTWDEYTGKPLGLRSAVQKISLTLLDLFFIIFKSASTALAFEALIFRNRTGDSTTALSVSLARILAAFMLIGLIAWVVNFTISVFRLVERLGGVDDGESR